MSGCRSIGYVAVLVPDYQEAIDYYTQVLGFALIEDSDHGEGRRWVLVTPSAGNETRLLLARASTPEQIACIGNQAGGRVFLFLLTADFWHEHRVLQSRAVQFCEVPREESYGTVAVFVDRYGNRWDLLQLAHPA